MKCYSYVLVRDYGFAPNPFYGYCTLATCKPGIRKAALKGDWVIGCGSAKNKASGLLVYAMRVDDKLKFNEYWLSKQFRCKRPVMMGSLKQMYGDNIYHFEDSINAWEQEDSHHSNEDGSVNEYNIRRDLRSEYVLISSHFWYFGGNPLLIPNCFRQIGSNVCCPGIGYLPIKDELLLARFISWLEDQGNPGYYSDPLQFAGFKRYSGK